MNTNHALGYLSPQFSYLSNRPLQNIHPEPFSLDKKMKIQETLARAL